MQLHGHFPLLHRYLHPQQVEIQKLLLVQMLLVLRIQVLKYRHQVH